jgi:IclR family transcriptional regulator, acetate operon repressor
MSGATVNAKTISTGTEAAERVADVLLALSRGESAIGVSAIARELKLSKAVVHRILQSLASRDLVRIDPISREYSLGPSATALGARALRQLDLRVVARDDLVGLRNETRETTTLSLLVVDKRTYVDQYESPQEIKMTVEPGRLYPLYAGASSRAILAFLPAVDVARVLSSGLEPLTEETIRDLDMLKERLAQVRANGFATSRGERQSGAGSVAAPVFRGDGRVVGSISVCGPLVRFDAAAVERFIPLVTSAAARISARLGWNSPHEQPVTRTGR